MHPLSLPAGILPSHTMRLGLYFDALTLNPHLLGFSAYFGEWCMNYPNPFISIEKELSMYLGGHDQLINHILLCGLIGNQLLHLAHKDVYNPASSQFPLLVTKNNGNFWQGDSLCVPAVEHKQGDLQAYLRQWQRSNLLSLPNEWHPIGKRVEFSTSPPTGAQPLQTIGWPWLEPCTTQYAYLGHSDALKSVLIL